MKTLILAIVFGLLSTIPVSAAASLISLDNGSPACSEQEQQGGAAVKAVYTCPMHPEIVQDKAGKCPKCGMNLTVKEAKKVAYTCPMHTEIVQDKAGKCPKCGMNLVLNDPEKNTGTVKK